MIAARPARREYSALSNAQLYDSGFSYAHTRVGTESPCYFLEETRRPITIHCRRFNFDERGGSSAETLLPHPGKVLGCIPMKSTASFRRCQGTVIGGTGEQARKRDRKNRGTGVHFMRDLGLGSRDEGLESWGKRRMRGSDEDQLLQKSFRLAKVDETR